MNNVSNVYFSPVNHEETLDLISQKAGKLLSELIIGEKVELMSKVPIKMHFGEKGNVTYVKADAYNGIIDVLEKHSADCSFIETNVLYRGERTTKGNHVALARKHGFTRLPVCIADGEMGEASVNIPVNQKRFKECKIGAGFSHVDQMVVVSHFKGHILAGFGGALKQLAMGCASRGGKLDQHAGTAPDLNSFKCTACGLCAEKCPVDAIDINDHAVINQNQCIGCAACIAVCPEGAFKVNWSGALNEHFYENIAEYALAVQTLVKNCLFVNFAISITRNCDCDGQVMKPIVKDLGIFAGTDPVAVDKACLDMLEEREGRKIFDGRDIFDYAEQIGLGRKDYNILLITDY